MLVVPDGSDKNRPGTTPAPLVSSEFALPQCPRLETVELKTAARVFE
jgi:hypothetical protein